MREVSALDSAKLDKVSVPPVESTVITSIPLAQSCSHQELREKRYLWGQDHPEETEEATDSVLDILERMYKVKKKGNELTNFTVFNPN